MKFYYLLLLIYSLMDLSFAQATCDLSAAIKVARNAVEIKDRSRYPQSFYSFDVTPRDCVEVITKVGSGFAFYPVLEIDDGYDSWTYPDLSRVVFVNKKSCATTWLLPEESNRCGN